MAHFSRPKHGAAPVPELCSRCRRRPGTTRVHLVSAPDAPGLAGPRDAWLCDECRVAVTRGAANS